MRHLRDLATSGLRAVHILPSFHFASVNEDKSTWRTTGDLSQYPPNGQQQQAAVTAIQGSDAYNWGYDPVHYMSPAGSYAMVPENRVREYRTMAMWLHKAGLRVVQDVFFNMRHIQAALQALTPEKDGVDGSRIYLYGEGWNFGDTANNQIGPHAGQLDLYGFGIGTFNDRIRDGIRGGSPFTDERVQG